MSRVLTSSVCHLFPHSIESPGIPRLTPTNIPTSLYRATDIDLFCFHWVLFPVPEQPDPRIFNKQFLYKICESSPEFLTHPLYSLVPSPIVCPTLQIYVWTTLSRSSWEYHCSGLCPSSGIITWLPYTGFGCRWSRPVANCLLSLMASKTWIVGLLVLN